MQLFKEFFFFGLVGVLGFFVDTVFLYVLKGEIGPYYARLISFLAAVFVTWVANRNLTFKNRKSTLPFSAEFLTYLGLMLTGGAVNYGVYAWLIVQYPFVLSNPVVGVAAGSIAGMCINFVTARLVVFRTQGSNHPKSARY